MGIVMKTNIGKKTRLHIKDQLNIVVTDDFPVKTINAINEVMADESMLKNISILMGKAVRPEVFNIEILISPGFYAKDEFEIVCAQSGVRILASYDRAVIYAVDDILDALDEDGYLDLCCYNQSRILMKIGRL